MATFATSDDTEKINISIFSYVPKLIACHLENRIIWGKEQRKGLKPMQNSGLILKEGTQMMTRRSSNDKWVDVTHRKTRG